MKINFRFIQVPLTAFVVILTGCAAEIDPVQQTYPVITTDNLTEIDKAGSVTLNGSLLTAGTNEIIDYGFVWSPVANEVLKNTSLSQGRISLGKNIPSKFSAALPGLITTQAYAYRSYAVTSATTVYGPNKIFTISTGKPWKSLPIPPATMTSSDKGFSVGMKGYAVFNTNQTGGREFWEYDASKLAWTRKADAPFSVYTEDGYAFSIGSKGYIGQVAGAPPGFAEYNPESNTWKSLDLIPDGLTGSLAFTVGGKAYLGIGYFDGHFKEFDPLTYTWKNFAGPPGTIGQTTNWPGFSANGKGYVMVGKALWELNTNSLTWTRKADYPGRSVESAIVFVLGTDAYVGTGFITGQGASPEFYSYSTTNDIWFRLDDIANLARYSTLTWTLGDKGYLFYGSTPRGIIKDFWVFEKN